MPLAPTVAGDTATEPPTSPDPAERPAINVAGVVSETMVTSSRSGGVVLKRGPSQLKVEVDAPETMGKPVIVKSSTSSRSMKEDKDSRSERLAPRKSVNFAAPGSFRHKLKLVIDSFHFKCMSFSALIIALFGGSLFILCAVPDEPGTDLQDVLMILVLLIFCLELVLRCIAEIVTYPLSFFFWMDALGTLSMLFEISFIFGSHGKMDDKDENVNTMLLRAARASKVGARAGRFSKVVKILNFLHRHRPDTVDNGANEARVLNAKLMMVLSSKVAMLTIALIMGVPLLNIGRYPVDDLSLRSWSRTLEVDYSQAYDKLQENKPLKSVDSFTETTIEFRNFYADLWYRPYKIMGYNKDVIIDGMDKTIPGEDQISSPRPDRLDFIVKQTVTQCRAIRPECDDVIKATIFFDFSESKKFEAAMDVAMIMFVIAVMALESADLSQTLDRMVVKPVEKMLGTVRMMAKVLSLVTNMDAADDDDNLGDEDIEEICEKANSPVISEAELLETVFKKLAKLTNVFLSSSIVDETDMAAMDYESQGILVEVLQVQKEEQRVESQAKKKEKRDGPVVANMSIEPSEIESWNLNSLELHRDVQTQVVTFVFFDSEVGRVTGTHYIDVEVFSTFLSAVRTGYNASNPYHNFIHACDVVCVAFRILLMVRANEWVSDVDMCALMIAALCHDIGHQGKTNPFLTETGHELALRYNDKSPLENMHSARCFEICKDPLTNVFGLFDKDAYKQARKVTISTILHTDNALHFDMVKDVKKCYELASDICDTEARTLRRRAVDEEFSSNYKEEVLKKNPVLWLELIMHMADISNPLKPFKINLLWASRVQDEFFLQGDEEKRLGIPVGMLNDRDKVNRAGSEHGFISFLVCPLVFAAVGCFPTLHPLAGQMATNMQEWRNYWVEKSSPKADDIKKRDEDIDKVKERVDELRDRKQLPTIRTAKTIRND